MISTRLDLDPGALDGLRRRLRGRVLTPADPGYPAARRLFNGAADHHPAVIARVAGPDDVAAALQVARDHDLSVSVRGGGHGVAGQAMAGDLVVDLSGLRRVTVDPAARTATAQGGVVWGELDPATQGHGLAVPGGRVSTTGIAGLTLGGGQGWLSGRHGLSCDNLLAVQLVTADGRVLTVDNGQPELWWALRGGGGNFGVVTCFTYRLHPVGPLVLGGALLHPLERAAGLAAHLAELEAAFPEEAAGGLMFQAAAPPAPFVPAELVGRPAVGSAAAWLGPDLDAGATALRPLRAFGPPLADTIAPLPYAALQAMGDVMNPPGRRHWWSAAYFPALSGGLVGALSAAIAIAPSPYAVLVLVPMGRAVNRVPEDATAFPHRASRWFLHLIAAWDHPADDQANRDWVRATAAAVRPYASPGTYLNADAASAAPDRVRATYGQATYARLAAVKATLDPTNVFRHTANVRPANTTGGDRCRPPR